MTSLLDGNALLANSLQANSIDDVLSAAGSPYLNAQDCVEKCHGLEFSDVYTASLLINRLVNLVDEELTLDSALLCEVFHVFLALLYQQRLGNSCLFIDDLADKTCWLASDSSNQKSGFTFANEARIQACFEQLSMAIDKLEAIELVWPRLYTRRFYHYEQILSNAIFNRLESDNTAGSDIALEQGLGQALQAQWSQIFTEETNTLSSQAIAVLNTLTTKFSIITGAAGTGKTYSVARLLYLAFSCLSIAPANILLLAPTGKAANRLQESISTELMRLKPVSDMPLFYQDLLQVQPHTLHRVLKINPSDGLAKYNLHNKLSAKLVIIDEASMVDLSLMCKLVLALPDDCHIALIGDPNQLPSVEAGCMLADIVRYAGTSLSHAKLNSLYHLLDLQLPEDTNGNISANDVPELGAVSKDICVGLRQGMRSVDGINQLAKTVLAGDSSELLALSAKSTGKTLAPWHFIRLDEIFAGQDIHLVHFIDEYVQKTLAPHFRNVAEQSSLEEAWSVLSDFVCLSPFRVGAFGTEKLNLSVANQLKSFVRNQSGFLKGQAIMIEKNDYALQLFNGDIGIVWPDERGQFWAWFPQRQVSNNRLTFRPFSLYTLPQNSAAYALTIHKTQGSEYDVVDILLPEMRDKLITRQLLYTAVTRAKTSVSLYSSMRILAQTLQNDIKRSSGLEAMLSMKESDFLGR